MAEDRVSVFTGTIITIKVNKRPSSLLFQKQEIGRIHLPNHIGRWSLVAQAVKNPLAMQEAWVWSLCWEDALEEGMDTHSSFLAWRVPMDRGAWWTMVHGRTESRTTEWLSTYNMFPHVCLSWAFLVAQTVQKQPAKWEAQVWSLGQEDALEKGLATTAVFLSGESHGRRSLAGNSPWSHRVRNDWATNTTTIHTHTHTHTHMYAYTYKTKECKC